MPVDPSLIQNNSQIYRVYIRRLSNPADQDIFITSAGKLTTFLSDRRAYYGEAQQKVRPRPYTHSPKSRKPSVSLVITLVDPRAHASLR